MGPAPGHLSLCGHNRWVRRIHLHPALKLLIVSGERGCFLSAGLLLYAAVLGVAFTARRRLRGGRGYEPGSARRYEAYRRTVPARIRPPAASVAGRRS